ncbi:MAG: Na+/H+ antiporter NhaC family protein [Muribaculaceae bacterium]|jgi:Na+/H+ antiporter NhaC|nr:Na+/H+ antiporter NhaC family protein [Muribaculaceae bacterium]
MQPESISLGRGLKGLSPVIIFLLLYVVVSLIAGDFYVMPFSVALLVASAWGVAISKGSIVERLEIFSRAAGHSNIIYMIWIFILAGAFASLAKEMGAVDATVALTLRYLPPSMLVPGMFVAACFISLSVGTSVGTVVALAPLAAEIAAGAGVSAPFMIAVVLGGAFFGDNLSFISDTTIASTRSQGCDMSDKFRANIRIALPAALLTLCIYLFQTFDAKPTSLPVDVSASWLVLPYLIVVVTAVARINVTIVLSLGILSALVMGLFIGYTPVAMAGFMGAGIDGMGNLIVITLMSAGMLGLVKACGGIEWLLQSLTRHISGMRGAEVCVSLLVGLVNMCTANNTVAIITVGSLTREISKRFGIAPRKAASLLDTSSCIVQCIIPYGAQTLLACSLAGISPAEPFSYLYYPWALAACVAVSIIVKGAPAKTGPSAR